MLYFSKIKIILIYLVILILSFFSLLNFFDFENKYSFKKRINLGLDLQGGSYLLLEIDVSPLEEQKLQNKLIVLRQEFKILQIKYKNMKIYNNKIYFDLSSEDQKKFIDWFQNKENSINQFYEKYKNYEMDYLINGNNIEINFSKYGMIQITNSSLDQSLEIVRRRIDEVGTREPTI